MFHMSREIYDQVEALAGLVRESPEFQAVRRAEDEGKKDAQLVALTAEYAMKRRALEDEIAKDEKNFDLIGALSREIGELEDEMTANPVCQAMRQARGEYEALLQGIGDVLRNVLEPDVQCDCSGDCASCGGCDRR